MCGCGGGGSGAWSTAGASSGYWSGSGGYVDGPWLVDLPNYAMVNGSRKVTSFTTVEVSTYAEASAKVNERDPDTGQPRGGGIRRKPAA